MTVYEQYVYAYPHKTAYRELVPAVDLREAWASEDRSALLLYVHIPFCEQRCGFCNLFTSVGQGPGTVDAYLDTLRRQARVNRDFLGEHAFSRLVIGGGTPTYLEADQLQRLFGLLGDELGVDGRTIPGCVEVSPETATPERLEVLRRHGVDRVSMGVQSFVPDELYGIHRRQPAQTLTGALTALRDAAFPVLNLDLMYGLPGQTAESFRDSIDAALAWEPAELYLYPLYVRPLTRMGAGSVSWDDERLALYRSGRDHLLARGFTQTSMRMFRAPDASQIDGPAYRCQEDGMVGLGCGARSYTRDLHYSSAYAVGPARVKALIRDWIQTPDADFATARWGLRLTPSEQARRFTILGLLQTQGLDLGEVEARFGAHTPDLDALDPALVERAGTRLRLTAEGLAHSDAVGPALFSNSVRTAMSAWQAR